MNIKKTALITGASSDIGMALCRVYLEAGYDVVAHYHSGQASFFDMVEGNGAVRPLQIDFSDIATTEAAIAKNRDILQSCDVLINAAALLKSRPFSEITAADMLSAFTINVVPAALLMQTVAPGMCARGWGRIVNIGSIGVKFGGGSASYCYALSKNALEFLPADYKKWAGDNVFINALRVGVTDTRIHKNDPTKDMSARIGLIPAKRMASPDEMAKAIYWYGSDQNTFTTGQTITIAGGE